MVTLKIIRKSLKKHTKNTKISKFGQILKRCNTLDFSGGVACQLPYGRGTVPGAGGRTGKGTRWGKMYNSIFSCFDPFYVFRFSRRFLDRFWLKIVSESSKSTNLDKNLAKNPPKSANGSVNYEPAFSRYGFSTLSKSVPNPTESPINPHIQYETGDCYKIV